MPLYDTEGTQRALVGMIDGAGRSGTAGRIGPPGFIGVGLDGGLAVSPSGCGIFAESGRPSFPGRLAAGDVGPLAAQAPSAATKIYDKSATTNARHLIMGAAASTLEIGKRSPKVVSNFGAEKIAEQSQWSDRKRPSSCVKSFDARASLPSVER
jgi:hypothetical protein